MNIGMLWFDNDSKTPLEEKIRKAADYYRQKYGRSPNLCMVNPAILEKGLADSNQKGKILIRPMRSIMPGHLWIGIDEPPSLGSD